MSGTLTASQVKPGVRRSKNTQQEEYAHSILVKQ